MKAIFISFNQALNERVMSILDHYSARGFTKWDLTLGRGSVDGEPHYANHAWPAMNSTIMTVVPDENVSRIMKALRELDALMPKQGLRAFVLPVEEML